MIDVDLIECEIINDINNSLIANYLMIKELDYLPTELNLYIIKLMLDNSDEMIALEKDKHSIVGVEIMLIKITYFMLRQNIKFSDYGLCTIIDNKINLLLKTLFKDSIIEMFDLDIPVNYEILKNEPFDYIEKENSFSDFLDNVKFFNDIKINENLKIFIIDKINEFRNIEALSDVFNGLTNSLTESLVKSMKINRKYLLKYDWCFTL